MFVSPRCVRLRTFPNERSSFRRDRHGWQGVLRECLRDPAVARVLAAGRGPSGGRHDKLRDLTVTDLMTLSSRAAELTGYDACFFSLGVSAAGTNEQQYSKVTYDLTLSLARTLIQLNPLMVFIYVSGRGLTALSAAA